MEPVYVPPSGTAPSLVAILRGLLLAAVAGAVGAAITWLSGSDLGAWAAWAPALILVLRSVEGFVDQARGQRPQAGLLGGHPADQLPPPH